MYNYCFVVIQILIILANLLYIDNNIEQLDAATVGGALRQEVFHLPSRTHPACPRAAAGSLGHVESRQTGISC